MGGRLISSGQVNAFAPHANELCSFKVSRGNGNSKLNFIIRLFANGNRYKLACIAEHDDTDYKELDTPNHSSIVREQYLEQDINEKLKIYIDSNGRIDYLALVDPTMNHY